MSVNCCIKSVVLGQEKNIVLCKSYVQYGFSFFEISFREKILRILFCVYTKIFCDR